MMYHSVKGSPHSHGTPVDAVVTVMRILSTLNPLLRYYHEFQSHSRGDTADTATMSLFSPWPRGQNFVALHLALKVAGLGWPRYKLIHLCLSVTASFCCGACPLILFCYRGTQQSSYIHQDCCSRKIVTVKQSLGNTPYVVENDLASSTSPVSWRLVT